MSDNSAKPPPSAASEARNPPQTPVIDLRELLAGGREAIIIHAGERYRLRVTAKDKLILTK
jgi:hemin uptake protein HemP